MSDATMMPPTASIPLVTVEMKIDNEFSTDKFKRYHYFEENGMETITWVKSGGEQVTDRGQSEKLEAIFREIWSELAQAVMTDAE